MTILSLSLSRENLQGMVVAERLTKTTFTLMAGFLLWVSVFMLSSNVVRAEERDIILEESGIHYPGGFDPNTVGEVQGKAFHFSRPDRGPVRFQVLTIQGTYTILTSPPWYWNDLPVKLTEGAEVIIRGSKSLGRDGNLYVIAQEIQIISSGQSFLFRGRDGTPLWKSSGWSGRGSSRESGPSPGGTSGLGVGSGSRGHGKR